MSMYVTDFENQYGDYDEELMEEKRWEEKEALLDAANDYGYPLSIEDDDLTFRIFASEILPVLEEGLPAKN